MRRANRSTIERSDPAQCPSVIARYAGCGSGRVWIRLTQCRSVLIARYTPASCGRTTTRDISGREDQGDNPFNRVAVPPAALLKWACCFRVVRWRAAPAMLPRSLPSDALLAIVFMLLDPGQYLWIRRLYPEDRQAECAADCRPFVIRRARAMKTWSIRVFAMSLRVGIPSWYARGARLGSPAHCNGPIVMTCIGAQSDKDDEYADFTRTGSFAVPECR